MLEPPHSNPFPGDQVASHPLAGVPVSGPNPVAGHHPSAGYHPVQTLGAGEGPAGPGVDPRRTDAASLADVAARLFAMLPGGAPVPHASPLPADTVQPAVHPAIPGQHSLPRRAAPPQPGRSAVPSPEAGFSPYLTAPAAAPAGLDRAIGSATFPSHPASFPSVTASRGGNHEQTVPAQAAATAVREDNALVPESHDGLRSFVEKIRGGQFASPNGLRSDGGDESLLQRLFSRTLPTGTPFSEQPTAPSGARPLDVNMVRRDFPILQQQVHGHQLAWLDNAATTQKPNCVIDAISRFYRMDNSNIHRAAHTLAARSTDAFERSRQKVQRFLNASSTDEIIFVRGTTEGINLVAQTFGRKFLRPGDEIILSQIEHHANIVPWQMIAREQGAQIRVIPVDERGELLLSEYQRLLGPRTKLVALTQASNSLGTVLPVTEMTAMAKRYGAKVLIDGAQSVSHIPVNLQELDCDFFVFSGHKIFGPTGIGVTYIKSDLHDLLPPWQGGGNMIKDVTFEETTYQPAPGKFEAGTPNIADTVGLGAALDYVSQFGLPQIGRCEHSLLEYAQEQLSRINGVRLVGLAREKVAVQSFVIPGRKSEEIGKLLDQQGIAVRAGHHCAQPSLRRYGLESTVRPSFCFYNTFDEVDRLADAVRRIQRQ